MTTSRELDSLDLILEVASTALDRDHNDESIQLTICCNDVLNGSSFQDAFAKVNEQARAYFWRELERSNKESCGNPGVSSLFAVARLASQNGDHDIAFEIVSLAAAIRNGESERDSFRAMGDEAQKYLTTVMDEAHRLLALEDKQHPLQAFDSVWSRCKFRN